MRLESIEYIEHEGNPQEWSMKGLSLGAKNLIVGENASGKSRALNIIHGLARSLLGLQSPTQSGKYEACFNHEQKYTNT